MESPTHLYLSIGCYVEEEDSLDQQFPTFVKKWEKEVNSSIRVILVDPHFREREPLLVRGDDSWKMAHKDSDWSSYTRNSVQLDVFSLLFVKVVQTW